MASKERSFTFTENNGVYTIQSYGAILSSYGYQYDECNSLTKLTCSVAGSTWSTVYTYDGVKGTVLLTHSETDGSIMRRFF